MEQNIVICQVGSTSRICQRLVQIIDLQDTVFCDNRVHSITKFDCIFESLSDTLSLTARGSDLPFFVQGRGYNYAWADHYLYWHYMQVTWWALDQWKVWENLIFRKFRMMKGFMRRIMTRHVRYINLCTTAKSSSSAIFFRTRATIANFPLFVLELIARATHFIWTYRIQDR